MATKADNKTLTVRVRLWAHHKSGLTHAEFRGTAMFAPNTRHGISGGEEIIFNGPGELEGAIREAARRQGITLH